MYLSDRAREALSSLQPELADSAEVQAVIEPLASELGRVDDAAMDVCWRLFPANADDKYRTLAMWEFILGLPVEQSGVSVAQRRNAVVALAKSRESPSGASWVDLISTLLGSTGWTHQEGPTAYNVTLTIPYVAGGITAAQLANVARKITPAHLQLNTTYTAGFLIGISNVGDAL